MNGGSTDAEDGLLRAGRKIEAIKAFRQRTGVDLKAAKDAMDARERQLGIERPGLSAAGKSLLFWVVLVITAMLVWWAANRP